MRFHEFRIQYPDQKGEKPAHTFRAVLRMEQGKWAEALADWDVVLDEKSEGVFVVAAWICARAAGNNESETRWRERLRERKTRWASFVSGEIDARAMQRVLANASLGGETNMAWDFFALGVARSAAGDRPGAVGCLRQAARRARDDVTVRVAAQRLLTR